MEPHINLSAGRPSADKRNSEREITLAIQLNTKEKFSSGLHIDAFSQEWHTLSSTLFTLFLFLNIQLVIELKCIEYFYIFSSSGL